MAFDKNNVKPRNEWLDVVRGLAILGVVTTHTMGASNSVVQNHGGNLNGIVTSISEYGRYGVELFFFLSGWLLVSIYGSDSSLKLGRSYWYRRAARIYPLWILFFISNIVTSHFGRGLNWTSARAVSPEKSHLIHSATSITLLTLTFTLWISGSLWNTVIPGGWSIQAEVGHYILFPLVRRYSFELAIKTMTMINMMSFSLYLFSASNSNKANPSLLIKVVNAWIRLDLFATFSFFFLGVISYIVFTGYKTENHFQIFKQLRLKSSTLLIYIFSVIVIPLNLGSQVECLGTIIIYLLFSFGLYKVKSFRRLFVLIGKYSFFIYFIHFKILYILNNFLNNQYFKLNFLLSQFITFILLLISTMVLSVIFATVSYRFIERPILKWAHSI